MVGDKDFLELNEIRFSIMLKIKHYTQHFLVGTIAHKTHLKQLQVYDTDNPVSEVKLNIYNEH